MEPRRGKHCSLSALCCVFVLWTQLQLSWTQECPGDGRTWVPLGHKCYHFVHGEEDQIKSYTFERAKTLCQHYEILSIESAEENDFVVNYSPRVWKGAVNVWLAMYYDTDSDDMKWHGNLPVHYTNWESSSFTTDLLPLDTCVTLHTTTGKWENVSCLEEVENGVVCEAYQSISCPGEEQVSANSRPLMSALVILSVVAIVGVSAVVWFLHQRHSRGSTIFTPFEYHPPLRVLDTDRSCLVESEETDSVP
ncbi:CD302 antigen [Acanthopagrus schlegelii]